MTRKENIMAEKIETPELEEGEKPVSKFTPAQQQLVNDIVKRERERLQARHEAEVKALQDANDALTAAQQKINEKINADCLAEIETLKEKLDPAVVTLFDALPASMSPEDKRDWLKKVSGEMPAPPPTKLPVTPKGKKAEKGWEPHPLNNPF